ncbi:hypothetical protein MMUC44124_24685 [Mycolicibacterium mucogenicum DSM 44124]|nr:hypothetical protein MMUC44124_24685 [Mycolicibacterium mucogenicum DSM 44124]
MFDSADLICTPGLPMLMAADDDEFEAREDRRVR